MIDVARLLPKLLNATGASPEMAEIATKLAWSRAAGDGLRRHAIPFRLFQKTLVVSVADNIWQKQMRSMSAELVSRINRLLGREVVDTIEFRIDPTAVERVRAKMQTEQSPRDHSMEPIPADLISAANDIADQDLRERFLRAAGNCIARREARDEK
jgi:predicted nucleic acid-binding Zn ribbon protein